MVGPGIVLKEGIADNLPMFVDTKGDAPIICAVWFKCAKILHLTSAIKKGVVRSVASSVGTTDYLSSVVNTSATAIVAAKCTQILQLTAGVEKSVVETGVEIDVKVTRYLTEIVDTLA